MRGNGLTDSTEERSLTDRARPRVAHDEVEVV